jgi:hypothetical protein
MAKKATTQPVNNSCNNQLDFDYSMVMLAHDILVAASVTSLATTTNNRHSNYLT